MGGAATVPRYGSKSLSMAFTASNTANCVIAAKRAWTTGFCPAVVLTMIAFHSSTGSLADSAAVESSMPQAAAAIRVRVLITMTPEVGDVQQSTLSRSPRSFQSQNWTALTEPIFPSHSGWSGRGRIGVSFLIVLIASDCGKAYLFNDRTITVTHCGRNWSGRHARAPQSTKATMLHIA